MIVNLAMRTRAGVIYNNCENIDEFCTEVGKGQPELAEYLKTNDYVKSRF